MIPVLFEIGPFKIYSFGFMLVVAFYSCFFLLSKELKRFNYDSKIAGDIVFFAALGGIIGSKVYYLIENFDRVIVDPVGMIFSGSGLVFLGGLLGGLLAVTWFVRKKKLPWILFADIVAPLLILGYTIGRIGCFLVGDDFGIPTHLPWGVAFTDGSPPTTYYVFETYYPWIDLSEFDQGLLKVHPTQLYEVIMGLGIFIFLWYKRMDVKVTGSLFFTYLILSGIERFGIEFIRTNDHYLFHLTGAQLISIIMIAIGAIGLLRSARHEMSGRGSTIV